MSEPVRGTPAQGLLGATLGFFTGFAAVALFGPTANRFQELMNLNPVMVGFLVAMPSLSGSLLRIPFSAWVDTTGGRKPFLVLLAASIAGMTGLTLVVHLLYPERLTAGLYPLLLGLGFLTGCGIATFSVGISQVAYWFPQKAQGRALGVYAGVGNLAPGIFSFLLPLALSSIGLAGAYLAWLGFLVVGTVLYAMLGRNAWYFQLRGRGRSEEETRTEAKARGQQLFPAGRLSESLKVSAGSWKTWALVGVYFTTFGGFIALTVWLPTYWRSYFALGAMTAGLLTALYSVLTSLMRVAGGWVSDRLGGEKSALFFLTVMALGAILMMMSRAVELSVIAVVLLAVGMGITNAAVFKLVPQLISRAVGGAAGWVGGLGAFGGFAIPPLMGTFVKRMGPDGYAAGFVVFLMAALISLGLAWRLKRELAQQRETAKEVSLLSEGGAA